MKKLFTYLAIAITSLSIAGCSVSEKNSSSNSQSSFNSSSTSSQSTTSSSVSSEYGLYSTDLKTPSLNEGDNKAPYEIYPTPHNIEYKDNNMVLPYNMDIVLESNIDEATSNHIYETLATKNIIVNSSSNINEGKPQVLVGIYDSNEEVANYVKNQKGNQDDLFNEIDSYYLEINENKIIILGKDSDACFYGITTLEMIFEQVNRTVANLEINDYSDCMYRGFIEGYYGIPWTKNERIDLMGFASKVKANIYIYAPKDDSYHSSNWRGLYTDADLLDLKEQIEAGNRTKTRFAWSIHPFISNPITNSNYEDGVTAVINKFEQLYSAGVRQFVISADDISVTEEGSTYASLHKNLLNEVNSWCKAKGDCYDLIFVPAAYCYQSTQYLGVDLESYFATLCDGLADNIQIMWTGDRICSFVSNGKFEEFNDLTGRIPFMWLNWPVTDYAEDCLLSGKGEVLDVSFEENEDVNFAGIVTNPMQQPEQSKLSIFAIADYCWNVNKFDMDQSYKDSMKYIEPTATEELYELCQHLTNASYFEGRYFEESENFKPYIEAFEKQYELGNLGIIDDLTEMYQEIIDNAEAYFAKASNITLKDSIEPWITSLKLLSEASILYLKTLKGGTNEELGAWYDEAEAKVSQREGCTTPILDKIFYGREDLTVKVSVSVLTPFLSTLRSLSQDIVFIETGRYSGVTYRGFNGVYEGGANNVNDDNLNTYAWFDGYPVSDAYVQIDLGEIKQISDIYVLQGTTTNDDYMNASVQVSSDGKTFKEVGTITSLEAVIDLRTSPVEGRYIRLVNNGNSATWVAIREVDINTLSSFNGNITYGNIELESAIYGHANIFHMIDGDESTFTWFAINNKDNAYIILDLLEVKTISNIDLLMANESSTSDYFHNYSILVSTDGVNYELIGNYTQAELNLVLSDTTARYVKILSNSSDPYGIIIREFGAY